MTGIGRSVQLRILSYILKYFSYLQSKNYVPSTLKVGFNIDLGVTVSKYLRKFRHSTESREGMKTLPYNKYPYEAPTDAPTDAPIIKKKSLNVYDFYRFFI